MKHTKPNREKVRSKNGSFAVACAAFVDSLPDEFEILQPGNVQVRWPGWLTREKLLMDADRCWPDQASALRALAAIAPEEKRKRKVSLWIRPNGDQVWNEFGAPGYRKVGECEVEE